MGEGGTPTFSGNNKFQTSKESRQGVLHRFTDSLSILLPNLTPIAKRFGGQGGGWGESHDRSGPGYWDPTAPFPAYTNESCYTGLKYFKNNNFHTLDCGGAIIRAAFVPLATNCDDTQAQIRKVCRSLGRSRDQTFGSSGWLFPFPLYRSSCS